MAEIVPIPHDRRFQDLTGQRFGRLTILGWAGTCKPNAAWVCRCDCGGESVALGNNIIAGRTRSCGCLNLEHLSKSGSAEFCARDTKRHPEYKVWGQIISRCHDPENATFFNYGGRGITVCDRWRFGENGRHGFLCFLDDMGKRPSSAHTLDRVKNDLGYSLDNCEWRTRTEQTRNRRNTTMVTYRGRRMPLATACELACLPLGTVRYRIRSGMSEDRALSQPIRKSSYRRNGSE